MGQENSKVDREKNSIEREDEKKIEEAIQKLKDKNERKKKQTNQNTRENKFDEKKLCHADQETASRNMIPENTYQSSACSMELEQERVSVDDKDKTDNDSDETVNKYTAILEGRDNADCVDLHNNHINQTLYVGSALVESVLTSVPGQEAYPPEKQNQHSTKEDASIVLAKKDMKISDKPKSDQEYDLPERCPVPGSDTVVKQLDQDDPELEMRNRDAINSCKNERVLAEIARCTGQNLTNGEMGVGEEMVKHSMIVGEIFGETKTYLFYDIDDKCFCERTFSVGDLNLPSGNVLCKLSVDCVDHLRVSAFWYPMNRPIYVHAIGFRGDPILLHSFGDQQIIKSILQTPSLRDLYIEDEHFRLATFSLSASSYKMGDTLRLSAGGYFFDVDGRIKCFCCKNTYRSGQFENHHRNCIVRYSNGTVGRSIADYYGGCASGRLVPSGHQEQRTSGCTDVHIRLTSASFRLGGTRQFAHDETVPEDNQENDNAEVISVRDGAIGSREDSSNGRNMYAFTSRNCERDIEIQQLPLPSSNLMPIRRQQDSQNGTQRGSSCPHKHEDQRSWDYEAEQSNNEWKTIRENVNRRKRKEAAQMRSLLMENARMRSMAQCCICNHRQCNIVLQPCGHLVVCDQCIANTTECPECREKVEHAYPCG